MNLSLIVGVTLMVIGLSLIGIYYLVKDDDNGNGISENGETIGDDDNGDEELVPLSSFWFIVENATADRDWGNYLYAQNFTLPHDCTMYSFSLYMGNDTEPWPPEPKNVSFEVRDQKIDGDPATNKTGLLYTLYHNIQIDHPQWLIFEVPEWHFNAGEYWLYVDLYDNYIPVRYTWGASFDVNSGNNCSPWLWHQGVSTWYNIDVDFAGTGNECDLLMKFNITEAA